MKYKDQAISKIEKIESTIRLLEMSVNRNVPLDRIHQSFELLKETVEKLKDNINAETDEWQD